MKTNTLTTHHSPLTITPCEQKDVDEIFLLYSWATQLQKSKGMVEWPSFPRSLVETEIEEARIWKLSSGDTIACVWSITFSDAQIWEEKDKDNAIYIHRIATRPEFRGNNFVQRIVGWSKTYANSLGKKYVRLDTIGKNQKLIDLYTGAGFHFLGAFQLQNIQGLPDHYKKNKDCLLFEMEVQ
ncbi:MAG TPA: GNAT family N-acetyltransferase [Flavitalea sp.]|nr:GNAT family N-acetyltransferase [Flavitalea sp.]